MQVSPNGRILVGVDGSLPSQAALRWAAAEARLQGMRLHVVYVRDQPTAGLASYAPRGAGGGSSNRAVAASAIRALICDVVGPDAGPMVQFELADGLPVRVLLNRAAGAAMLVLGSTRSGALDHASAGEPRAPLGPVARECLHAAPCPVVIVAAHSVPSEVEPVYAR
jgi:nucleotide-binding universal stress UspA family protein